MKGTFIMQGLRLIRMVLAVAGIIYAISMCRVVLPCGFGSPCWASDSSVCCSLSARFGGAAVLQPRVHVTVQNRKT